MVGMQYCQRHIVLLIYFLISISSVTGTEKTSECSVDTIINFDNEPTGVFNVNNLLPAPLPPIPGELVNGALVNVMGESKGILFERAGLVTEGLVTGVRTRSAPNSVLFRNGSSLTVTYSNLLLRSFSLSRFFFGCNLPLRNAAASVAVGCKLTIIGSPVDATQSQQTKTFTFIPQIQGLPLPVGVLSDMQEARVVNPEFKNMKRIDFRLDQVEPLQLLPDQVALLAARLDDFSVSLNLIDGRCKA